MKIKPSIVIPNTHEALLKVNSTTGVYVYTQNTVPLYVGKAINLKARLLSHEQNAVRDVKEAQIVNNSDSIGLLYTDSELQALLLEAHLISMWKPKYNVRWRDNKSYLYIKITIRDEYPKIFLTRREDDGKSQYFGPFGSVKSAESLLRHIRRVIPFCTQKGIYKRPCFYHKIGLCNPCPSEFAHEENAVMKRDKYKTYMKNIHTLREILEGKTDLVFRLFKREITSLTQQQKFEQAIQIRNAMKQLELLLRFGDLNSIDTLMINRPKQSIEALKELLNPFYDYISTLSRIECYDNSTLGFEHSTASMVVFTDGMVDKKEYRRFKIRAALPNDFDMMKEVLSRRITHKTWAQPQLIVIDGGRPQLQAVKQVFMSSLIGHKSTNSQSSTKQQTFSTIPYIGIAKNPDRLVVWDRDGFIELKPARDNLGFRLVQNIRDEAHRFAKKYHTHLRTRSQMIQ